MAQGQDSIKVILLNLFQFNNFKDFLNYEKKGKNIIHLDLSFKS